MLFELLFNGMKRFLKLGPRIGLMTDEAKILHQPETPHP